MLPQPSLWCQQLMFRRLPDSCQLLPDRVRVLGPDHTDVLTTRNNVAGWTAQSGGDAGHESEADPDGPKSESKISGS
jgi:hypothetical protein